MPGKPRILIVDDEEMVREALECWFNVRGFDVDHAVDGLDAVEKCRQNEFDVITMDLQMPRMDGPEAIAIIKSEHPHVPIVVLTGFLADFDTSSVKGVAKVLTKPLQFSLLETEIRDLLALSEP